MKRLFSFVLCAVLLLAMCVGASALEPDGDDHIAGIDVSVYQGEIDFDKVRAAGVEAVYIRGSVGAGETDARFASNAEKAKAAGLSIGAYAFVTARTPDEARAQARRFAALLQGVSLDMRPAAEFDVRGLDPAQAERVALAYFSALEEATGFTPMLYTDSSGARDFWPASLSAYPLWVADYRPASQPPDNGKWTGWAGWQYSDTGRVDGITGNVDLNVFTEAAFLGNDGPAPERYAYIVRKGDTLSAIARRFGITVDRLARENNLQNPNRIYPGQAIFLPGIKTHVVQRGDTLTRLARRYGTTVSALARINEIKNVHFIKTGAILFVPN